MGLNIKNEEVVERVRKLAAARGLSLTEAVDHAVAKDLANATGEKERMLTEKQARINARLARIRASVRPMADGKLASDTSDFYDDYGLPK